MRDSIEHVVDGHEAVIGSDLDTAVYQELGTEEIPPRSFLGFAAHEEGHRVAELIGERVADYLAQGDVLHRILHLEHKAAHELKETAHEILHEDEKPNDK
jgi:hypothetical protein